MTAPTVSNQLEDWARRAGYALTPRDETGAAVFWTDPGGELRFFIRQDQNGWLTLSSSERGSAEQFELSATSMAVISRYLWGLFGSDFRSRNGLPRLKTPTKIDALIPEYSLSDLTAEGVRTLSGPLGPTATARGKLSSISTLVELSHLLTSSIEDTRTSYESGDGRPLFDVKA